MVLLAFPRFRGKLVAMIEELPSSFDNRLGLRVAEVAELVGVAPETVIAWIKANELPATKFGRTWIVPIDGLRQRFVALSYPARLL